LSAYPLGRVFRFERPNAASERRPVLCQKPCRIAEKKAGVWTRKVPFHGFLSRPELIDRVPTHLERSVWLHTGRSDGRRYAGRHT
jgi:hypothetical protein